MDTQKIFEAMQDEGFRPKFDDDGDITFKYEGKNYAVLFDAKDEHYLSIGANFSGFSAEKYTKAKEIAHTITKEYKVGKCFVLRDEDDDEFRVRFVIEMFTAPEIFARDMLRHLDIISDMIADFLKQIDEDETTNDSGQPWQ